MIGAASALFLLGLGRVAGISGLLGGLLAAGPDRAFGERIAFLVGLVGAPVIWTMSQGAPSVTMTDQPALLIVAGLLVGYGTQMGAGCTSGHGVCGLSRFSPRSAVAVGTFMFVAAVTVAVGRHLFGAF